jgi:hypothetical protein
MLLAEQVRGQPGMQDHQQISLHIEQPIDFGHQQASAICASDTRTPKGVVSFRSA